MRADRLLSLVLLLRNRGRMTAAQLARELEVSTRTVLRDVDALSTAGIPVYAERGRDGEETGAARRTAPFSLSSPVRPPGKGGFALLPGFTTDLTGLTHDEALALLTAQSRATPEALGLGPAFAAAVRKIVAAMPDAARREAVDAADRVLVRRGGWLGDPDPDPHLAAVRRAVFAGKRLRLRYAAREEPARWRTVDPVGLVEAGGRWYLLATRDGVERTYRISRVDAVEELDDPVHREPEVDLEEAWERRRAAFAATLPTLVVTVRVPLAHRAELAAAALSIAAERPAGPTTCRSRCRSATGATPSGCCGYSATRSRCWPRRRCGTRSQAARRRSPRSTPDRRHA